MDLIKLGLYAPHSHIRQLFVDWLLRRTVEVGTGRVCELASLSRECTDGFITLGFCIPRQPYHQEGILFAQAIRYISPDVGGIAIVLVVDDISKVAEWKTDRV